MIPKVRPGQPFEPSAAAWNAFVEMANQKLGVGVNALAQSAPTLFVLCQTLRAVALGSPVALGGQGTPAVNPLNEFLTGETAFGQSDAFRLLAADMGQSVNSAYSPLLVHGIAAESAVAANAVIPVAISGLFIAKFKHVTNRIEFPNLGAKTRTDADRFEWFERDPLGPHRILKTANVDGGGANDRWALVHVNGSRLESLHGFPEAQIDPNGFGNLLVGPIATTAAGYTDPAAYNAARIRVAVWNASDLPITIPTVSGQPKPPRLYAAFDAGSTSRALTIISKWC